MRKLLITGISGGQGRLIAKRLRHRWQIIGVDRDPWEGAPEGVTVHQLDLRKRRFENILRTERPHAVIHLGFVRHFRADPALRHEVNVAGTKRLLGLCAEYGVRQLLVMSSHYVYGALPENARYVDEDHPLNASRTFPEIRDLCESEGLLSAFLWRYPNVATSVLRPVNVLGPYGHSAIGSYLKLPIVPTIAGFDPMMQFIHEDDIAKAVDAALENEIRGVFNVAGPGAVPLSVAADAIGKTTVPVPDPLAQVLLRALFELGIYSYPPGALDYLKYPCTVADDRFRAATGFTPDNPLGEVFAGAQV